MEIDGKAIRCPHCQADQRPWPKKHPILTGILVIVLIFVVLGAIGGGKGSHATDVGTEGNTSYTSGSSSQTGQTTPAPEAVNQVDVNVLVKDFDTNQLAAIDKYKDKTLQLTAYVKNISKDIMGNPFLSLEPVKTDFYSGTSIQCIFDDASQLTSLANGQQVTVKGKSTGMTIGIIGLEHCQVIK